MHILCIDINNNRMKALRLNGGDISSFMIFRDKIVDLSPSLPKSYIAVDWSDLNNCTVKNKNVILAKYGDIHPYKNGPIFECETLFLHSCDKNFLAYWLSKHTFPNLKKLYVGSHPSESYTLDKYANKKGKEYIVSKFDEIYLHERFATYKQRWWPNIDNIKIISASDYDKELESYESEELILDNCDLKE